MRKKNNLITKIATFALAGVMAVGMCGTGNVAKAAEEDWVVTMETPINDYYFPDENFRKYITDKIDTDKNGGLNDTEIEQVTTIDIANSQITSLEGLDVFENLKVLKANKNTNLKEIDLSKNLNLEEVELEKTNLSKIDISKNTKLKLLNIAYNEISELDLSNNSTLEELICNDNNLTELDVTKLSNLTVLRIDSNDITTLNIENNKKLNSLNCDDNNLTKLDLSNNSNLKYLHCGNNKLKKLDISGLVNLFWLDCLKNEIEELDFTNLTKLHTADIYENNIADINISNCKDLVVLNCNNNNLSSLDLSGNEKLSTLHCINNNLTELDLSNNKHMSELYCRDNPLTKIDISQNDITNIDCDKNVELITVRVSSIKLDKTEVELLSGQTTEVSQTISPADATIKRCIWTSSNPSVATVDANGLVTAKAVGNATITATADDLSGVTASCTVTVKASSSTDGNTGSTGGNAGSTENNTGSSGEDAGSEEAKVYPAVNISYRTHIQTYGWEGKEDDITTWKSNGTMSGTSGKAKRLEGINIVVDSADSKVDLDLGIQYTTHCQSYGWLPWSADGDMNGTEGEAKRLEAIMIKLTGADADAYDVYYRVHAQTYGWLGWAKNGAPAGTAGYAKRLEGIQIVVVKKNESFNQKMGDITSARTESFVAKEGDSPIVNYPSTSNTNPVVPGVDTPNVAYRTHVQSYGWQAWKYNGQMSGTSGESKRLEGINIKLTNKPVEGGIVYTTHVQKYGWQGDEYDSSKWKSNGQMSGTSGEAKRLEAIKIKLTGEMANHYDIYYRVHAQSYGWLAWASNGAPAGTAGYGKRLEGIQIVLVKKGDAAPGKSYKGIDSVNDKAYISKTASSSKDMTFECNDKSSFQLKTHLTYEKTGHYVKELKGWTYSVSKFDGCNYDEFVKDGIHIRYSAMTEDQVNDEIDQISEDGNLASLDFLKNEDSYTAIVAKCTYDGSDRNITLGFRYYKKLSDGKYLSIFVYDEQGGNALGDARRDTFLPLTENKFYIQAN